tara:strand:+ start:185 stop:466 length:282 start_codon:yes stop_codon:yes gene_type:complete
MQSSTYYTNRYGDPYFWHPVDENTYEFKMPERLQAHCRMGFKLSDEERVDYTDLSFFDPSGGPFVDYDTVIDGKKVCHIEWHSGSFYVEVCDE